MDSPAPMTSSCRADRRDLECRGLQSARRARPVGRAGSARVAADRGASRAAAVGLPDDRAPSPDHGSGPALRRRCGRRRPRLRRARAAGGHKRCGPRLGDRIRLHCPAMAERRGPGLRRCDAGRADRTMPRRPRTVSLPISREIWCGVATGTTRSPARSPASLGADRTASPARWLGLVSPSTPPSPGRRRPRAGAIGPSTILPQGTSYGLSAASLAAPSARTMRTLWSCPVRSRSAPGPRLTGPRCSSTRGFMSSAPASDGRTASPICCRWSHSEPPTA